MASTQPPGDRVAKLALGDGHSCALLASGRVACWGDNGMGQLGNGSDRSSFSPLFVPDVLDAIDIRASRATTCIIRRTGAVACWGDNAYGQANPTFDATRTSAPTPRGIYNGTGEPPRFTPAHVLRVATTNAAAAGARSLSLGSIHGCALLDAGAVRCWGDASHGQLGVAAPADGFEVQPIVGVPPFVEVASAQFYSCGRTADGAVWCWGANEDEQLGTGEPGPRPRQVPGIGGATGIQLAANRACAWGPGGRVTCWGDSLACGEDHAEAPAVVPNLDTSVQFVRAAGDCAHPICAEMSNASRLGGLAHARSTPGGGGRRDPASPALEGRATGQRGHGQPYPCLPGSPVCIGPSQMSVSSVYCGAWEETLRQLARRGAWRQGWARLAGR